MKTLKLLAMSLIAALAFTACDNDDDPAVIIDPVFEQEIVVLNNGNWGANDANILRYSLTADKTLPQAFLAANGRQLGDLGQDIAVVGQDIYIAVNGSQVVFVTDRNFQVQHEIVATEGETKLSPRYFCVVDKKVYVTYYEGYLGEINTKDYTVRTTPVGNSPEGVAYADGTLYVANSGGANYPNYDNTLSVVDAKTFKETDRIEVNLNPQNVIASPDGKTLFVNSFGNYADIPAKLQSISTTSHAVSDLDYTDVKSICQGSGDNLYVVTGGYDENWNVAGQIHLHDMKTNTPRGLFVDNLFSNYYSISFSNGYVCVGLSDYKTNGDVLVYDDKANFVTRFDAQGLNPQKVLVFGK